VLVQLGVSGRWSSYEFCEHCAVGYNDFFLENEEYRPFDECKIEI
jgi:hypothetical protein